MKIKEPLITTRISKYKNEIIQNKKLLIIFIYSIFIFFVGAMVAKEGLIKEARLVLAETVKLIKNDLFIVFNNSENKIEQILFDIEHDDYQRLMYWKSLAVDNYSLNMVEHDYVNATMNYNDRAMPIKLRLKGSTAHEHQDVQKWSFRVKIKGENRLFGMKSFSLMSPERRNYLMEWLFRKVIKQEGVISKKYGFVNIKINGIQKGIYAFDEHFSKEMIENNQRRDGPIIRFSDDSFWLEKAAFKQHPSEWGDYYFSSYIDAIESKNYSHSDLFQEASDMINSFRQGDLNTSEVFDMEKLAKTMAIGDLFGAWHGFVVFNNKFYYNPITRKLEPIPDDSFTESKSLDMNVFRLNDKYITGAFLKQVFNDINFTERYLKELHRVTEEGYLDSILLSYNDEIIHNIDAIRTDYPLYVFPKDKIYINQKLLKQTLSPNRAILGYFNKENLNSIILNIASTKSLPVEIISATYDNEFILRPNNNVILEGREYLGNLNYIEKEFYFPSDLKKIKDINSLKINYKILGINELKTEPILNYKSYNLSRIKNNLTLSKPNHEEFNFLKIDSLNKTIKIKSGEWELKNNLIIPKDYIFIAESSTSLDFIDSSLIISYSPLRFEGNLDQPINLISSDSTGKGIIVFSNRRKSILDNVTINNFNVFSDKKWKITGAVSFYESPVYLKNSYFINIKAEDALNIINSDFIIENTVFQNCQSDALDADFCNGSIINSTFSNSGNDAIDISGSDILIDNVIINKAIDKGISVGENSIVSIANSELMNCRIGVAVKDESQSELINLVVNKCEYGIAGYQKKPEFGPPTITARSMNLMEVSNNYLIEEKSSMSLDNVHIQASYDNVYEILYK